MKKTLILSCALALAGLSNVAMAATSSDGTVFVRAELGHTAIDVDMIGDDSDTTTVLRGGYYFTPNFAVEAFAGNVFDGNVFGYDAEFNGYGIGGIAKKNFGADNTGFFIDGRAGVMRAHAELGGAKDDTTEPYIGVGAGYDFSKNFGLSVNYDVIQSEFDGLDVDVETLTLGAEYRF